MVGGSFSTMTDTAQKDVFSVIHVVLAPYDKVKIFPQKL